MTDAVVRLWLKVADAAALTAREALQRALGYGRTVRAVSRSELWAFRWDTPVDAEPLLSRLGRDTNLLLNPNKHHMEIAIGENRLSPRGNIWILVSTAGDGADMEETLVRRRLVEGAPPRVRRAVLWELDLDAAEGERVRLGEEIAITRSRRKGLLANPHVQDAEVFAEAPTAARIGERLVAADNPVRVR